MTTVQSYCFKFARTSAQVIIVLDTNFMVIAINLQNKVTYCKSFDKPEGERVNINHLIFVWRIRFYYDTHLLAVYLIFQNTRFRVMQVIDRIIVCPSQSQFPNELSQILHTLTIAKKIHFYKEV